MTTDKRIGVLMGGSSAEREISIRSGTSVFKAVKDRGYDAALIEIMSPKPNAGTQHPDLIACRQSEVCEVLRNEKIDVAFLALHGGYGENGAIQGLLEVMDVPYTGSGVLASALAMDKEAAKKIFLYHGIPVPLFVTLQLPEKDSVFEIPPPGLVQFGLPWVIKPSAEGSSIGVSIARNEASVRQAINEVSRFSERIIIEKYIEGREIQTGILNNKVLGSVEVRPRQGFYSYEAKYTPGLTEYILPPEIDPEALKEAEKTALLAHKALGCKGASRVDLIIDSRGVPYVLEVNTIPGMTETSLLPKIAGLAGLDFIALIEEMLGDALS